MTFSEPADTTTPEVSVVIACRNVAAFIDAAVWSVRRQTLGDLELLIAEDGSTDGTLERLEAHAREDARVRILRLQGPSGAGAARNAALDAARGRWIAILDGDDYLHPERLERLLTFARDNGADIVADNQVVFDSAPRRNPRLLLEQRPPRRIDVAEMVRRNVLSWKGGSLGYLKPIISREFLLRSGVRYDTDLRIGEDYDFLVRLLARGAALWLSPQALYFYRKHPQSTSYRLAADDLTQMQRADEAFAREIGDSDPKARQMLDRRAASVLDAMAFVEGIDALKTRRLGALTRMLAERPTAAVLVLRAILEGIAARFRRLFTRREVPQDTARRATIITRQRINGSSNGSSAYLLSLATSLRAAGFDVELVVPSAGAMGRWPWMTLEPEMRIFERIRVRGAVRMGDTFIRSRLGPVLAALPAAIVRGAARLGLPAPPFRDRKAPYSVTAPWTIEDYLYLGRETRPSRLLLADYCYQAPALPYALQPCARSMVVMHDLFWRRRTDFSAAGKADTTETQLTEPEEMKLLGQADAILAIQAEEAALVRARLPATPVILTQMPAAVELHSAAGEAPALLFVGSDTAANVHGAEWFLDKVWPEVRRRRPDAQLWIAGSVRNSLPGRGGAGVSLLGVTPDLAKLYRTCAVVISPLTLGSGLKIKLVEALGMGKAVVATSVTLAGVDDLIGEALLVADTPEDFAEACLALLEDVTVRHRLGELALDAARKHFSAQVCHREFIQTALSMARTAASPA